MTTLHRQTTTGVPVRIEIDEWQISAYREEPAQVLKREYRADGSVHIETEPELSRHLTSEPLKWVGLSWRDAEVRSWLKNDSIMTAALAKVEAEGGKLS